MFYLIGVIFTFFLVLILVSKSNKNYSDRVLALWLFFIGFHLLLYYFFISGDSFKFPYLLGFEKILPLVHGPFLFLYTATLTSPAITTKRSLLHFISPAFIFLLLLPFLILPSEQKIYVYQHDGIGYDQLVDFIDITMIFSGIIYVFLSLKRLFRHKKTILNHFSHTEKINLIWIQYLILGIGIIWMLVIFGTDENIFAAVVVYVFFIGYFGIQQVGVFTNTPLLSENFILTAPTKNNNEEFDFTITEMIVENEKIKYEKSGLNTEDIQKLHKKLDDLMQNEKPFKNPDINLTELSHELDVHPNMLSQAINSIEEKNFYDYINFHRIEEFKTLIQLPENKKFTLLSLAYECGFNSKTSFNRNFKKITGFSPTEYSRLVASRQQLQNS